MINNLILEFTLLYITFEVYEVSWQKADNIALMLGRMYKYYSKSVFLFLLMHPTYYFSVFILIFTDFNIYAFVFFGLKSIDIATKMILLKQVFIDKEISQELSVMLLMPINKYMPYIGLLVYPPLLWMALS